MEARNLLTALFCFVLSHLAIVSGWDAEQHLIVYLVVAVTYLLTKINSKEYIITGPPPPAHHYHYNYEYRWRY